MLIYSQDESIALHHEALQAIYIKPITVTDLGSPSGKADIGYKVVAETVIHGKVSDEDEILIGEYSTVGIARNVLKNIILSIQDSVDAYRAPKNICPSCGEEIPVHLHIAHVCEGEKEPIKIRLEEEHVPLNLKDYATMSRTSISEKQ